MTEFYFPFFILTKKCNFGGNINHITYILGFPHKSSKGDFSRALSRKLGLGLRYISTLRLAIIGKLMTLLSLVLTKILFFKYISEKQETEEKLHS